MGYLNNNNNEMTLIIIIEQRQRPITSIYKIKPTDDAEKQCYNICKP